MQPRRAWLVHRVDVAERGRVVAGVRAVEHSVAHHRLAQARLVVGAGHRVVHVGEHVAAHEHVGAYLEARPHRAGVLADGHAVLARDARVLRQLVEHGAPARVVLRGARRCDPRLDVGRQLARQPRDGRVDGVRDL